MTSYYTNCLRTSYPQHMRYCTYLPSDTTVKKGVKYHKHLYAPTVMGGNLALSLGGANNLYFKKNSI